MLDVSTVPIWHQELERFLESHWFVISLGSTNLDLIIAEECSKGSNTVDEFVFEYERRKGKKCHLFLYLGSHKNVLPTFTTGLSFQII